MGKRHRDDDDSSASDGEKSSSSGSSGSSSSGSSSGSESESSDRSQKKEKRVDKNVVEEKQKAKNREATLKRSRMWQVVSSEDEDDENKDKRSKKKDKDDEHRHHHHHRDSDSHEKDGHHKRKRSHSKDSKKDKKRKKKDKKKEEKKKKKEKKKHHEKEKKHKSKKKDLPESMRGAVDLNQYGSRGILRESDFTRKKHDFEIWLDEVKGVPMLPSAKWEVMKYFRQYMEDYNTATFPSEKYYDVDKWEMDEFRQKAQNEHFKAMRKEGKFDDEQELAAEKKKAREKQEKGEVQWALSMMSKDKREAIMEQEVLKAKMQAAYKSGDMKLVRQIEYQLLPDEEKQKMKRNAPDF